MENLANRRIVNFRSIKKTRHHEHIFAIIILLSLIIMFAQFFFQSSSHADSQLEYTVYTVRTGDSLWSISENISTNKDIREVIYIIEDINNISSSEFLKSGQIIKIPVFN